jgi:hypothetical protein
VSALFYKLVGAAEVSNLWRFNSSKEALSASWIGNGCDQINVRSTQANNISASTLVLTGALGRGSLISVLQDRDTDSLILPPTSFVERGRAALDTFWPTVLADWATAPGGSQTWTSLLGSSGFAEVGWLLEIT